MGDELARRAEKLRQIASGSDFLTAQEAGANALAAILDRLVYDLSVLRHPRWRLVNLLRRWFTGSKPDTPHEAPEDVILKWVKTLSPKPARRWLALHRRIRTLQRNFAMPGEDAFPLIPETTEAINYLLAAPVFDLLARVYPLCGPLLEEVGETLGSLYSECARRGLYGCFLLDAWYRDPITASPICRRDVVVYRSIPPGFWVQMTAVQKAASMLCDAKPGGKDTERPEANWLQPPDAEPPAQFKGNGPLSGTLTDLVKWVGPELNINTVSTLKKKAAMMKVVWIRGDGGHRKEAFLDKPEKFERARRRMGPVEGEKPAETATK